jgi:hypothetical protein
VKKVYSGQPDDHFNAAAGILDGRKPKETSRSRRRSPAHHSTPCVGKFLEFRCPGICTTGRQPGTQEPDPQSGSHVDSGHPHAAVRVRPRRRNSQRRPGHGVSGPWGVETATNPTC